MVVLSESKRIIALFDVDGTLTVPRRVGLEKSCLCPRSHVCSALEPLENITGTVTQGADKATLSFLQELRKVSAGFVGPRIKHSLPACCWPGWSCARAASFDMSS